MKHFAIISAPEGFPESENIFLQSKLDSCLRVKDITPFLKGYFSKTLISYKTDLDKSGVKDRIEVGFPENKFLVIESDVLSADDAKKLQVSLLEKQLAELKSELAA